MLVETSYVCLILRHVALSNASILLLLISHGGIYMDTGNGSHLEFRS